MYILRCQQVYNAALEGRRETWRKQRVSVTLYDQQKELTALRANDDAFAAVPATVLRSGLRRLDLAFGAFFRRAKTGQVPGFPRFKARDRYKSFSLMRAPVVKNSRITIPKLGPVKFHEYRPIQGRPLDATIRKDARGWSVSIHCDMGAAPTKTAPTTHVGVDVGLSSFATLSTGEKIENPRYFRKAEELLAERQRELARKKRGSASRKRAKALVARAHEKIRNQRLDFVRKLVVSLYSRFDIVAYEDLAISRMVHGNLSKSIMDAAWGLFGRALACKAEGAGKWAVAVDPRGTSQRCSRCGEVSKKTLSDRVHLCACGPPMDRDHNAAVNIEALGLSALEAA